MLYPQNGSIAKGSRRSLPTVPVAAAVVSEERIDPKKTPWFQSRDWKISGMTLARRPPKRMASIGTPAGSSHSGAIAGSWDAGDLLALHRSGGPCGGVDLTTLLCVLWHAPGMLVSFPLLAMSRPDNRDAWAILRWGLFVKSKS